MEIPHVEERPAPSPRIPYTNLILTGALLLSLATGLLTAYLNLRDGIAAQAVLVSALQARVQIDEQDRATDRATSQGFEAEVRSRLNSISDGIQSFEQTFRTRR